MVRQPSDRDTDGNPVPVTPQHFGTEPMRAPPPPSTFLQSKFFFHFLYRLDKADRRRRKNKPAEKPSDWMTLEYVRDQVMVHIRDPSLTVQVVAQNMVRVLEDGMAESRAAQKKFLIGSYKLPHQWLDHYLGLLLGRLRQLASEQ